MTKSAFPLVIGLDIGRSACKVAYRHMGVSQTFIFPSNVCLAQNISHEETAAAAARETVEVKGTSYFTGLTAQQQGGHGTLVGMSDDWVKKPEYLALVGSAINRIKQAGITDFSNAILVIGSPSALYDDQRKTLADITRAALDADIRVLPQPSGAYFAHILDEQGDPVPGKAMDLASQKLLDWAVIELGHYTTDYIMIQGGRVISKSFDSTEGIGSSISLLGSLLQSRHGIKATDVTLGDTLISGKIKHFGKEVSVEKLVQEAVAPVGQKIIAKADQLFDRDAASLDGVLLAGGGASFVHDALAAKWPHLHMLREPRMAVAQGFLRYGLSVARRNQAAAESAQVQAPASKQPTTKEKAAA